MTQGNAAPSLRRASLILAGILAVLSTIAALAQTRASRTFSEISSSQPKAGPIGIASHSKSRTANAALHRKAERNDSWQPQLPLFVPAAIFDPKTQGLSSTAIADLNHDGKLDVVNADALGVGVFLGNGDGTLQPVVSYDTGDGGYIPSYVTVADVNGDGKPDILVVNSTVNYYATGRLAVLLGNGDGTFQPAVSYDPGGYGPQRIVAADVNRDGKLDLIVSNQCAISQGECAPNAGGVVSILLGHGDGTFEPAVAYNSGGYDTSSVAVADVNGDHKLDVIVTSACTQGGTSCVGAQFGEGTVAVLLGNGDGTFRSAVNYDAAAADAGAIVVKDLNKDGKQDLVVSVCLHNGEQNCNSGGVDVFLGNGDGTFQLPVTYFMNYNDFAATSIAVADIDGDGKLDIAAYGQMLTGNGDGTFGGLRDTGSSGWGLNLADMNGDGLPDLVDAGRCNGACQYTDVEIFLHVGNAAATTSLTSTPNPSVYGQAVFTTTVSGGLGIPTGSVIFYNQSTQSGLQSAVPLVNGTATVTSYNNVDVGTDPIFAVYQGSAIYHPGFSAIVNQVVTTAPTTTTVVPSANPGFVNKTTSYTVTVTSEYGGSVLGTVACLDNGSAMRSVKNKPLLFQNKYATPGTHTISCAFSGDSDHYASNATITEQIFYPTTTKVTSSGSPSHVGQPVTFTATVTSPFGTVPDGEIVTFGYSNRALGTAPTSGGVAVLTTAALPKGKHAVQAIYPGDTNFNTSSGSFKQLVEP